MENVSRENDKSRFRKAQDNGSGKFKGKKPIEEEILGTIKLNQDELRKIREKIGVKESEFWINVSQTLNEVRDVFRPALFNPKSGKITIILKRELEAKAELSEEEIEKNRKPIGNLFREIKNEKKVKIVELGLTTGEMGKTFNFSSNYGGIMCREVVSEKGKPIEHQEIQNAIEQSGLNLFKDKLSKGNFIGAPIAKEIKKITGKPYRDIYRSHKIIREVVHRKRMEKIEEQIEQGKTRRTIAQGLGIRLSVVIGELNTCQDRKITSMFSKEGKSPSEIAKVLGIEENEIWDTLVRKKLILNEE